MLPPRTDPAELRRRAAVLERRSRETPNGVLACHLLIRALRLTAEASALELAPVPA